MLKRTIWTILSCGATIAIFSGMSLACACCAEPGTYYLRTIRPDAYRLGILSEFQFAKSADLFMTEAGYDMIRGLDPVRIEDDTAPYISPGGFDLVAEFTRKTWNFNIKTPKGLSGTLTLPLPAQMLEYKVDIHDEAEQPNGPLLYKEFRFKGSVAKATGFTRGGFIRGTSYFLVFQGRGNGCDDVSDFTNWRLEISGPKADYAFFGKLTSSGNEGENGDKYK